ncbi:MAG: hypothetical protein QOE53_1182, partial [Pseudonocardiales bacterium]|nr:hypothetical protein [Pseudonocardiales bacterium]
RVLVVAMHHILSDGWSMQLLRRDLQELLAAVLTGRPAVLPVLGRDHFDYAVDRCEQASSPQLAAARDWWRAELAGLAGPLELPTDVPRGSQPADGASLGVLVGSDAVAALRRLCEDCDATLFAGVLAVVSALLHRLTGADDVPIGTPRAQRAPDETELVGFCVATLLLRLRIDPAASFRTHLLAARATVQGAFEHEDVPFEVVSADAGARRNHGENPLFETMCALQDTPGRVLDSAGPVPEDAQPCVARFELSFYFTEVVEGLLGSIEYRSDLFQAARIRRCRDQLLTLWQAATSTPDAPLRDLAIEGPSEVAARVRVSAGPVREVSPVIRGVAGMLATRGGYPAIRGTGVELSYAELADRVGGWLAGFAAAGLTRGDRLVVALDRGPDAVAAAVACLLARVGYLPLDPYDPPARLAQLVESSGARAVAADGDPDWRAGRPIIRPGTAAVPPAPVEGSGDDCAYVIHTSGSTGQPKAAAVAHRTLDNLIGWQLEHGCVPRDATTLQYAPLGFDVSLQEMLSTLAGGGTLVVIDRDDRRDAHATLDLCARYGVQRMFLPPLVLRELAQAARLRPEGAGLREVICAGEALIVPDGMARLLAPGGVLVNQYGPAETHVVTAHTLSGDPAGWPTVPPIGLPISNVHVEVRDAHGAVVPLGSPGELVIAGPSVGLGYLGDPADGRFGEVEIGGVRMPSYATGDRVVQRDDGCLVYLGRADRQVKVRGFRIEPAEVEAALEALPGVRAAAVDAVPAPSGRRILAAWVESDQARDWRADLAGVLPRHLLPDTVTRLDQLPRTSSGKVDRARLALPEPAASDRAGDGPAGGRGGDEPDGVAGTEPGSVSGSEPAGAGVRAVVRDTWEQLLKRVVARDDVAFFDLGGDSLLAMRLATRLHDRLGLPVSVREVFEHPGVGELAAHLRARGAAPAAGEPAPDGTAPPVAGVFPATDNQAGLWFLHQLDARPTAYQLTMDVPLPRGTTRQQVAAALTVLAARHPALRTSLREQDGVLVQDVAPPAAVAVREVRLPDSDPAAARTVERQVIAAERDAGCDLRAGPLFRAMLVRSAAGESRLVLVLHHAIADGWSLDVLRAELAAVLDGRELGPVPRSFADWAAEQAADPDRDAEHRDYWTAVLAGADLALDLPSDRPRPAVASARGATRAAVVDARTAQRLRELAGASGTTPFAVLLAATSVLLGRLARTEDLLLGVPMANRTSRGIEQAVGYFANAVVVRGRPVRS